MLAIHHNHHGATLVLQDQIFIQKSVVSKASGHPGAKPAGRHFCIIQTKFVQIEFD
jgi:hypothetical protein